MKVKQKISDLEVANALNFLATNWRHNPLLRSTFGNILEKLRNGSKEDQQNANILENYLTYPGSDIALQVATSLHAATRTQQGRQAAGLPIRQRGKTYSVDSLKLSSRLMQELIKHDRKESNLAKVVIEVIGALDQDYDDKTIKKIINELRPKVIEWVTFLDALELAAKEKTKLSF